MKLTARFFLLIMALIAALNLSSASLLNSAAQKPSLDSQTLSVISDEEIIKNISENPLRLSLMVVLGWAVIAGFFYGIFLNVKFIAEIIKNHALSLNDKFFQSSNIGIRELLMGFTLVIFFYSSLHFINLALFSLIPKAILSSALMLNAAFEFLCIITLLYLFKWGRLNWSNKIAPKLTGSTLKSYAALIPLLGAAILLNFFIFKLFSLKPEPMPVVTFMMKEKSIFNVILLCLEVVVFAPLFEEILFRGVLFGFLRKRFSFFSSAFASAVLFSLLHNNAFAFLPITILGMALAYIYEEKKSILSSILVHSCHNLFVLIVILTVKFY